MNLAVIFFPLYGPAKMTYPLEFFKFLGKEMQSIGCQNVNDFNVAPTIFAVSGVA